MALRSYFMPSSKKMTIIQYLTGKYPDSSLNRLKSWIKQGRVMIDSRLALNPKEVFTEKQHVRLLPPIKFLSNGVKVLYSDQHIVAIEKPKGLLSVKTKFETEKTAHAVLKKELRYGHVLAVHRLDQDTSGVMIFALSKRVQELLKKEFEKHHIKRSYAAIVRGFIDPVDGTLTNYLFEDKNYFVHVTENKKAAQLAISHYKTVGISKKFSWLDMQLETGKKNQLRVQLSYIGHPIVGDKKYGSEDNPLRRLCLHAYQLAFKHPITKKKMVFISPIPESFYRLVKPKRKF